MIRLASFVCALALTVSPEAWAGRGGNNGGGNSCLSKASRDCDGDGLSNGTESSIGSNPLAADTDGDGLDDGLEHLTLGTSPTNADTDGDGLDDAFEHLSLGTSPTDADTDDDGLFDGAELTWGTDPFDADTDGDWLKDGAEVNTWGSDPLDADSDADGFADNYEAYYGSDPNDPDTDGDGSLDGDDAFPFDDTEWIDHDGDGIGDNSDHSNVVDDLRELPGGLPLAAGTFPQTLDLIYCGWDTVGPISGSNPNCDVYNGLPMTATQIAGSVEWDEWLDADGVWNFRWGGPTIAQASIRLIGPRIQPEPGYTTCYEGEVQSAGGGFDFGWGVEWLYYFQTGQFQLCIL